MKTGTGCLSGLARALAIVIVAVVVVSLPAALMLYDLGQVVFSREKIDQIIGDHLSSSNDLRQSLVTSFLSQPSPQDSQPGAFNLVRAAASLSPVQSQELTNLLLPEDWFRGQTTAMINALFVWLDGDQPRPEFALDLRPIKDRLLNGGAQQLMLLLIDSWPQCLSDQLAEIEQSIRTTRPPPILYCKPPSTLRGVYTERTTIWLTNQVRVMPDSISLTGEGAASSTGPDLADLRDRIRLARDFMHYGWMIPASLFGLIVALAVRSWLGLSRWWGTALAATGVASLVWIPFARPLETRLLGQVRPGQALPPVLTDSLAGAVGGIREAVVAALAAQAFLLILVGAGLFVGGWLLSRRLRSSQGTPARDLAPQEVQTDSDEPSERRTGIFG